VLRAVEAKRQAVGTREEGQRAAECSSIILEEYRAWGDKMKTELREMRPGAKAWWAKEKQLQLQKQKVCSIPPLKDAEGTWRFEPQEKANLLAKTLRDKYHLPDVEANSYTTIAPVDVSWTFDRSTTLTVKAAENTLKALDVDSATGPDMLPTRILKQ